MKKLCYSGRDVLQCNWAQPGSTLRNEMKEWPHGGGGDSRSSTDVVAQRAPHCSVDIARARHKGRAYACRLENDAEMTCEKTKPRHSIAFSTSFFQAARTVWP